MLMTRYAIEKVGGEGATAPAVIETKWGKDANMDFIFHCRKKIVNYLLL